jgi:hypothetical protein
MDGRIYLAIIGGGEELRYSRYRSVTRTKRRNKTRKSSHHLLDYALKYSIIVY